MKSNITVEELLNINEDINIVDIRSPQSYNNNHIPNSVNVPLEKIITNPNSYLKRTERYYIYCQRGTNSKKVCAILQKQGFKVINIIGGYEEWILLI